MVSPSMFGAILQSQSTISVTPKNILFSVELLLLQSNLRIGDRYNSLMRLINKSTGVGRLPLKIGEKSGKKGKLRFQLILRSLETV